MKQYPAFDLKKDNVPFDIDQDTFDLRQLYVGAPAINQSLLKQITEDPTELLKEERRYNDGMRKGDALDVLIFDGPHAFKSMFYPMDIERPSGKLADAAMWMSEQEDASWPWADGKLAFDTLTGDKGAELPQYQLLIQALTQVKYEGAKNTKTLISHFCIGNKTVTPASDYLYAIMQAEGRTLLGKSEHENVTQCAMTLQSHPFTKAYCGVKDGWDYFYQIPIFFNEDMGDYKVACKGLLDILMINHKKKVIIPVDLKSTGQKTYMFGSEWLRWKYYLQSAMYYRGLSEAVKGRGLLLDEMGEKIDVKGYKLKEFRFVVISTIEPTKPIVRTCTHNDLIVGTHGGKTLGGYDVRGYRQLIGDLRWHHESNKWDYTRPVYDKKGHIPFDLFQPVSSDADFLTMEMFKDD